MVVKDLNVLLDISLKYGKILAYPGLLFDCLTFLRLSQVSLCIKADEDHLINDLPAVNNNFSDMPILKRAPIDQPRLDAFSPCGLGPEGAWQHG